VSLPPIKLSSRPTNGFWNVPVLFEDEHVLALDKPADLRVTPDATAPDQPSLLALMEHGIKAGAAWATARNLEYLAVTHRLDPDNTGVVVLAKDRPTLVDVANQFGAGQPCRHYLVVVIGQPPADAFEVKIALAPHPTKPGVLVPSPSRGKKTITRFEVMERFGRFTVLRCEPLTNRPQQINIHLRWVRLPLVGDRPSGGAPLLLSQLKRDYRFKLDELEKPLLGRAAVHLDRVTLKRPGAEVPLVIESPLPKDFQVALKYLRRYAA
jgi:23S rRNA-/tRNA-specific pseudouridylate synthase